MLIGYSSTPTLRWKPSGPAVSKIELSAYPRCPRDCLHLGQSGTEQDVLDNVVPTLCPDWSPKRPRLTEPAHMPAQLAIGVGEAAIVPPEHDTGSASSGRI